MEEKSFDIEGVILDVVLRIRTFVQIQIIVIFDTPSLYIFAVLVRFHLRYITHLYKL